MTLKLDIITPEKIVFSEEVDSITVPTLAGEITVLPHHEDLIAQLGSGELRIRKAGKESPYALTGGVLEVSSDKVNILAEHAIAADDIQVAKAKEAQERAQKKLEGRLTDDELRFAQGELLKALAELKVAVKYKRR